MRGDTVHGGALENGAKNVDHRRGAPHLHWYLSPGVRNGPGITRSTALTKISDSHLYKKFNQPNSNGPHDLFSADQWEHAELSFCTCGTKLLE